MKSKVFGLLFAIAFAFGMVLLRPYARPQSAPAGQASDPKPAREQTVGEAFKNIQVLTDLKDAPQNELYDTMDFISGSLAVNCNYCHAGQQYESDAKKTKLTARNMIRMMRTINETNFGGHPTVTCNTCHQGSTRPLAIPGLWKKTAADNKPGPATLPDNAPSAKPATALPDVDQVMANYRKAVGSEPLSSMHITGTQLIEPLGFSRPFESYVVLPDKVLIDFSAQSQQQVLNGDHGWILSPRARTPLSPAQLNGLKVQAESFKPVKFETSETPRKVTGIEKIGDRSYYVVESLTAKKTRRLYFDVESGLLYRARVELTTPLGIKVEETTFEDYRDVNGAKLAYAITVRQFQNQIVYKISEIQTNIAVDPARFEPAAPKESKAVKHDPVNVDPKILDVYVGDYELAPGTVFTVARDGEKLFLKQGPDQRFEIFAASETEFFMKQPEADVNFVKDNKGQITGMVLHTNGGDLKLKKIK